MALKTLPMIIESLLQIELNLNNKTKINFLNAQTCYVGYQVYARKMKKNHISFFNLLHNFVSVGVYQLK